MHAATVDAAFDQFIDSLQCVFTIREQKKQTLVHCCLPVMLSLICSERR
jgi:hypothetical protein